jgi:hypothetical protein
MPFQTAPSVINPVPFHTANSFRYECGEFKAMWMRNWSLNGETSLLDRLQYRRSLLRRTSNGNITPATIAAAMNRV